MEYFIQHTSQCLVQMPVSQVMLSYDSWNPACHETQVFAKHTLANLTAFFYYWWTTEAGYHVSRVKWIVSSFYFDWHVIADDLLGTQYKNMWYLGLHLQPTHGWKTAHTRTLKLQDIPFFFKNIWLSRNFSLIKNKLQGDSEYVPHPERIFGYCRQWSFFWC